MLRSSGDFSPIPYWEEKDYDACLIAIRKEIESYKDAMADLDPELLPEDEYKGKMELYVIQIDNLMWANIQTLLKMRRYVDALLEVERYALSEGSRSEEAFKLHKRLLRKLY